MKTPRHKVFSFHSPKALRRALVVLQKGGILLFPTDTVYGIGCDARNKIALARLSAMKGRPKHKPFPILASDMRMVRRMAEIPLWFEPLPEALWPGPWTFVLPARRRLPRGILHRGTVAIRIPDHKRLRGLIRRLGRPIVGTSANRAGKKPPHSARAVAQALRGIRDGPDMILDGGVLRGRPSVIIDASGRTLRILRH